MGHFEQQIMFGFQDFLNNGFIGTVMPNHFDFDRNTGIKIKTALFVDPSGSLADNPFTHCGAFIR
ncbi:Uncharacterised protein [Yersinia massiliensis]|nr:Uncharacterised protein [Yersinia massiliensis]